MRSLAWLVVLVAAAALLLYEFAFDVWVVPGDDPRFAASIAPTLAAGDLIVLSRHPTLEHGYLVRCADPEAPGRFVVARAMAQGGQTVSVDKEVVVVDGRRVPDPRACDSGGVVVHDPDTDTDLPLACEVEQYGEADFSVLRSTLGPRSAKKETVDRRRWFLVSDDRHVHLDSRDFGAVDPATCEHAVLRLARSSGPSVRLLW